MHARLQAPAGAADVHGEGVRAVLDELARLGSVRVRDDGCGLDDAVAQTGQRPGHWGLVGMRERAAGIGASLRIDSRPGAGTQIEVSVPGRLAY